MKKQIHVACDMGSAKIFTKDVSLFFDNGVGDGLFTITIFTKLNEFKQLPQHIFMGHFTVKTKNSTFLSRYDCDDIPVHTFGIGRWFVYTKNGSMYISFQEGKEGIHA